MDIRSLLLLIVIVVATLNTVVAVWIYVILKLRKKVINYLFVGVWLTCLLIFPAASILHSKYRAERFAIMSLEMIREGRAVPWSPKAQEICQIWASSPEAQLVRRPISAEIVSDVVIAYDVRVMVENGDTYVMRLDTDYEGFVGMRQILWPHFRLAAVWPPDTIMSSNGRFTIPTVSEPPP